MAQHRVSMDEIRAMGRLRDAFARLDMDVILQRREEMHSDDDDDDDRDEDMGIFVADNIPVEVWNRFAAMNTLPHNLELRQLVWAEDKVWLAEY